MASFSSSFIQKISPANAYTLKLAWSGEQDIVNNSSIVTIVGTISRNGSTYTAKNLNSGSNNTVVIDDVIYNPTTTYNLMDYSSKQIFSYTQNVVHDEDGNKTVNVSWSFDGNIGDSYNPKGTISTSIVLPTIHRASNIHVSDGVFGESISIFIDAKNDVFTHDLTYVFHDLSGTIAQGIQGNYTYTIPLSWMDEITNSVSSKDCVITCITKYGNTVIGTTTYSNFVLTVPPSVVPVISDVTVTRIEDIAEVEGFVQNKTSANISINCSGSYGSTIKSTIVTLNGENLEDITKTGLLTKSGSNALYVKVTDTRGRTAEKMYMFEVKEYTSPSIQSFSVKRCVLNGSTYAENDEEGTYAKVVVESNIVDNIYSDLSPIILSLKYKKESSTTWSTITLTYNNLLTKYISGFEADSSYDFQVVLSDAFESVTSVYNLASTHMILDVNPSGRGLAVGKSSEKEHTFEVGYDLDMDGNRIINANIVDLVYPVGSIYMSVNNLNPATLFGGTWERIKDTFLLASGDSYANGAKGGSSEVTLTEENIPSHKHGVGTLDVRDVSLTGRTTYRDVNTTDSNLILSASGIFSYSKSLWSGSHWAMSGASASGYYYQHLDIDASHKHTLSGDTNSTGEGAAFDTMPPYLAVYMWKRTA